MTGLEAVVASKATTILVSVWMARKSGSYAEVKQEQTAAGDPGTVGKF